MAEATFEKRNRATRGRKILLLSIAVIFDILPFLILVSILMIGVLAFQKVDSYLSWIPFHSWLLKAAAVIGFGFSAPVLLPIAATALTLFQWMLDIMFFILQGLLFWVVMHAPPWDKPSRLGIFVVTALIEAIPGVGYMVNVLFPHAFSTYFIIRNIQKEDREYNEEQERKMLAARAQEETRQMRRGFLRQKQRKRTPIQPQRNTASEYGEAANDNYEAANDNEEEKPVPRGFPVMDGVKKAA